MHTSLSRHLYFAAALAVLSACGGGGGAESSSASTQGATSQSVTATTTSALPDEGEGSSVEAPQVAGIETLSVPGVSTASTTTSLVPLAPVPAYTVSTAELVLNGTFSNQLNFWSLADSLTTSLPSEIRSGGRALRVNSWAGQKMAANTLQPGKSYVLAVTARKTADAGTASMSVVFRNKDGVSFRNFRRTLSSTWNLQYTLHFTAPVYTAQAEVSFSVSGVQIIVDSVSLKMEAPITQTEPVTSLVGSYVPAGYGLAFNDEFNGTSLNTKKWFTRYIYDGGTKDRLNDEKQRYRDNDNHRVANGVLSLVAHKVTSSDPQGIDYESGMIRSDWTTRYGYIEARVKMPSALGIWPAFWLNSDVSENGALVWPPEIDIFELVNNGVEDRLNMLHSSVVTLPAVPSAFLYFDADYVTQWTYWKADYNFSDGWHTIAAEWTPTSVRTYVDGKKIVSRAYEWKDADGQLAGPAHILMNLAVGGQWAGRHGIDAAAFPQSLQISWVRAYKKLD